MMKEAFSRRLKPGAKGRPLKRAEGMRGSGLPARLEIGPGG